MKDVLTEVEWEDLQSRLIHLESKYMAAEAIVVIGIFVGLGIFIGFTIWG